MLKRLWIMSTIRSSKSDVRFRELFDEAPVAYHEIDGAGVIRRVNRAECALFGCEAGAHRRAARMGAGGVGVAGRGKG